MGCSWWLHVTGRNLWIWIRKLGGHQGWPESVAVVKGKRAALLLTFQFESFWSRSTLMLNVSPVSMAWRDRDDCIPLPLPHQGREVHFSYNTPPLSPSQKFIKFLWQFAGQNEKVGGWCVLHNNMTKSHGQRPFSLILPKTVIINLTLMT